MVSKLSKRRITDFIDFRFEVKEHIKRRDGELNVEQITLIALKLFKG